MWQYINLAFTKVLKCGALAQNVRQELTQQDSNAHCLIIAYPLDSYN